jgi:TRAP transporter TAXI family solute receptor
MAINNIHDPSGPFVEMQLSVPMVHLSMTDDCLDYLFKNLAHVPHTIPKNTYKGQTEDIKTATMFTVLVANEDVPEDVIYRITKIICENEARFRTFAPAARAFTAKKAHLGTGVFLHPGARKYYIETGQLK